LNLILKIWQLRLYLGAILYKQGGKMDREKYVKFLEEALRFEDTSCHDRKAYWGSNMKVTKFRIFPPITGHGCINNTKTGIQGFAYGRIMAIIKSGTLRYPSSINIR
jgi:hypothetical protein